MRHLHWLYKAIVSPFLGTNCRFHPTCSEYAKQAFEKLPWTQASWRTAKRVLSCHPFHPGGYDPVEPGVKSGRELISHGK